MIEEGKNDLDERQGEKEREREREKVVTGVGVCHVRGMLALKPAACIRRFLEVSRQNCVESSSNW